MPGLIQLIYISNSTQFDSEEKLAELLKVSRKNNSKNGLTGMLLYHDGQFFQVLEGKEEDVMATFEKIKRDIRHRACRKMAVIDIENREFRDWTMGYYKFQKSDTELALGYNRFMQNAGSYNPAEQQSEAQKLLHTFRLRAQATQALEQAG